MLEWLKRHAWKACIRQKRIGGSNPPPSAKAIQGVNQMIYTLTVLLGELYIHTLKGLMLGMQIM